VTTDPAEELELRMAAGNAAGASGHMEAGLAHFERARELAMQMGDAAARRRSVAAIGNALVEGHHLEAERVLSEAYDEPGLEPEDPGFGELAEALAKVKMRLGKDEEALRIADRAFPALEASGDRRLALELAITRGVVLSNLHRFTEAIITLTGARQVADQWNVVASFLRASTNLGYAYEPEDPVAGYELTRVALERARRYGFAWAVRYLLGNAATTAIDIGDWDWAAEQVELQLQEGPELREALWFEEVSLTIRAYRGEAVAEQVARVRQLVEGFDDTQYLVLSIVPALDLAIAEGRGADLVRLAREAMQLGRAGTDMAWQGAHGALLTDDAAAAREFRERWEADVRPGRRSDAYRVTLDAALAALEGRGGEARQLYAEAQARWRELGQRHLLALCQLQMLISGVGEASERRRAADEARAFWESVGAVALLARLDEAEARGPAPAPSTSPRPSAGVAAIRTGE
jgi:hypothetical protein